MSDVGRPKTRWSAGAPSSVEAVDLATEHRFRIVLTQTELSDAVGLTPVHFNRVLKEMREKGLITMKGGTLVIAAWDELTRAGELDPTYLHLVQRQS
ncbi:helix-turn-helix domain-containing protein [uncultured Methylobacterium sp.]|uniref:helix-turn-helix domain-containing protein n=1 Tax=uncultured Methylobacterium sp. TaxID=157278 RepID=UPI0025927A1C|nr:helix-turn-helix domain-containing protein [uncultured Methylobacterium sp.]